MTALLLLARMNARFSVLVLNFYETHPTDIDECIASTHNCHGVAYCYNNDGSFTCECRKGYTGDGLLCEPMGKFLLTAWLSEIILTETVPGNYQLIAQPVNKSSNPCNSQ